MGTDASTTIDIGKPNKELSAKKIFGIDSNMMVPAFSKKMIMCLILIKIMFLTKIQPWLFSPALNTIDES